MSEQPVTFRPLAGETEARFCADFIAASDPWMTLGMSSARMLPKLTNPAREVWVATVEEKIAGVMIIDLTGLLAGYIPILAVHPDFRCRGIGTRMLEWAEERIFRRSPNIFLCVSSFNTHARKLYERLGFQRVGEFPDFLVKGHSEILMRKTHGPLLEFKPSPEGMPRE